MGLTSFLTMLLGAQVPFMRFDGEEMTKQENYGTRFKSEHNVATMIVILNSSTPFKVGYSDFYSTWYFDPNGKLICQGAWE